MWSQVPATVQSYIRLTPGARCDKKKKRWYLPLTAYQALRRALWGLVEKVSESFRVKRGAPEPRDAGVTVTGVLI